MTKAMLGAPLTDLIVNDWVQTARNILWKCLIFFYRLNLYTPIQDVGIWEFFYEQQIFM